MQTERRDEIAWNFTVYLLSSQKLIPYDQLLQSLAEATGRPRDDFLRDVLDELYVEAFALVAHRPMEGLMQESSIKHGEKHKMAWCYLVHRFFRNGINIGLTMRNHMVSLAKTVRASGLEMAEWYDELIDAVIEKGRTQR